MGLDLEENEQPASPAALLKTRAERCRTQAGLTLRAASEKLGFPHSYISRVESGERLPSEALAESMDEYYGTDGLFVDLRAVAVAAAAEAPKYGHQVLESEKRAARIQVFNASVVPGLLQAESYTTALYTESMPGKDAEHIAFLVAKRAHRREVLEGDKPPLYWAIVDEAALRRPVGGPAVMAEQIRHILRLVGKNTGAVKIQVVPFSSGVHPLLGGSLSLLALRDGASFAYVEAFASGVSVETPEDVAELATLLDIARTRALDTGATLDLLNEYLREYDHDC
ncbi:helix-turn-helix transcriptional regulator [Streptomyces sp. AM 3-1-1]|uniref:helix-turn-helix domain-containing protein n=1 Tax=Streptomyces sp. AM 3-1-1 TaxID=3028711 RepID=UPI0023B9A4DD|nr:helix-turn-helix transcriptional regulator [Streptomyces sp. AM 3-1-1]WEH29072.1 helix-turn-helix transcriptional regulator [Streptomyces sp. AM 3-1-1]